MGRFAIGATTLLAPSLAGRLFGLDVRGNHDAAYLGRLFASRDFALGAGLMATSGEARRTWVLAGIACDLSDIGAAVQARREGMPPATALLCGGAAVIGAALGLIAHGASDEEPPGAVATT
jgi:hypothetical protein